MKAVELENISKSYGNVTAIKKVSCVIDSGELFGFIGPDGAGKTTLFRIITTLLLPDSGNSRALGLDCRKDYLQLRKLIGYMPGRFSLYEDLTVEENLKFYAEIFNASIKENYALIKDIYSQIEPFKKRKAGSLSGGMKQKLALSCALIHKPEILVLDEPTTGVDAVSRKEFWEMLKNLQKKDITIIVSTPYMDEAMLCDRTALMFQGRILKTDSPDNIVKAFPKKLYGITAEKKFKALTILRNYEFTDSVFPFGDSFHYADKRGLADMSSILAYLKQCDVGNCSIKEIKPSIEDAFMVISEMEHE